TEQRARDSHTHGTRARPTPISPQIQEGQRDQAGPVASERLALIVSRRQRQTERTSDRWSQRIRASQQQQQHQHQQAGALQQQRRRHTMPQPRRAGEPASLLHTSQALSRRKAPPSLLGASLLLLGGSRTAAAQQIAVSTPLYGKEAGELFTTTFSYSASGGTTGDLTSFDIELRSHDDASATTGCGETVFASLCTRDDGVCMDSDGAYDVQIPEDAPAGAYSMKVMLTDDSAVWACTNAFNVTLPQDGAGVTVVAGEPSVEEVEVDASASSGVLSPGQPFTARWVYDDGSGDGGEGTFEVNLNACSAADGDCDTGCGTFASALCGDAGCYDPGTGDYDVLVPADQALGEYKLEVISTADPEVSGCSEASFSLVTEGTDPAEAPTASPVVATPAPSPPPLPTFAPVAPTPAPAPAPTGGPSAAGTGAASPPPTVTSAPSVLAVVSSTAPPSSSATAGAAPTGSPSAEAVDTVAPLPATPAPSSVVVAITPSPSVAAAAAPTGTDAVATPAPLPATSAPAVAVASTPSPTGAATVVVAAPTPAPTVATTPAATVLATDQPVTSVAVATPSPIAAVPVVAPTASPVAAPVASPVASSTSEGEPGSPGFPPSPVPAKVVCDDSAELEFVYTLETTKRPLITVAHASGDRTEAGCLTLTKLYDWLATEPADVPTGMLLTVDPTTEVADSSTTASPTGVWLLDTSIEATNGVTFEIKGTLIGGDCDELKFSSTVKKWNRIFGHGGNIDIDSTYIRSWDATKTLDHIFKDGDDGKSPRSYIGCISEQVLFPDETCDGTAQNDMGECRMDIADSTLAYLGYDSTEAYGITWKVRGLCDDLSNNDELFESVRVYGDMKNSDIYGMWYGHYSYGHLGGVWTDNLMHDNHVYGFDPHDDSDYLTISGNTCYNNGNHGIIASKRCDHLLVENNESYDNEGSGIMLHKSCDDSIVRGNTVYGNGDAGLSIVETSRCVVSENDLEDNRWGFRVILGSTDNVFDSNTLTENSYSDIYSYYGADEEVAEVAPYTGINVNNVYRRFLRSTDTHVVDNVGDAASGDADDITDSCFTPESDRLPLC
ncbi:unnamed protein product, partial [Scytosiphon promiscuus]